MFDREALVDTLLDTKEGSTHVVTFDVIGLYIFFAITSMIINYCLGCI